MIDPYALSLGNPIEVLEWMLLALLIICGVTASVSRSMLNCVMAFICCAMAAGLLWVVLLAPEIAIVQILIGAGATGVMFIRTLSRMNDLRRTGDGSAGNRQSRHDNGGEVRGDA